MKTFFISFLFLLVAFTLRAQFAPQAGIAGSTALHKTSPLFRSWATGCTVKRGLQDISDPLAGFVSLGDSSQALGVCDGSVVSLGDSGMATLTFGQPIFDGPGPDFAVFENGFQNPANLEEAFLELAFVEVSSDGKQFFRFPAASNTQNTVQIRGAGDYMDARLIHNLAGKYAAQYGTPFDLAELKSVEGLDVMHITHVRIVDVVGSIGLHGTKDANGQQINDPYPTAFPTGGFDLDAVGAISISGSSFTEQNVATAAIFPNPTRGEVHVMLPAGLSGSELLVADLSGRPILRQPVAGTNDLDLSSLQPGLYLIGVTQPNSTQWIGKCTRL